MPNKNAGKSNTVALPAFTSTLLTDAERQLVVKTVMNNTAIILGGTRFAEIDPNCIRVDYRYQRAVDMNKVKRIADNWDPKKAGVITCSHRDKDFWSMDGQNRTLAARLAGVPSVPIQIFTGLTAQEEALLFANQDENKSKVSNLAKYNANLFAGTEYAVKLNDTLAAYGLTLATGKGKNEEAGYISCTAALQELVLRPSCGFDCLDWLLATFKRATWLGVRNAMVDKHVKNMGSIWREGVMDNTLDSYTDNLVNFLSQVTPAKFQSLASHAFSQHDDPRTSNRSLFYAVARGEIMLTSPIIAEVFSTNCEV